MENTWRGTEKAYKVVQMWITMRENTSFLFMLFTCEMDGKRKKTFFYFEKIVQMEFK